MGLHGASTPSAADDGPADDACHAGSDVRVFQCATILFILKRATLREKTVKDDHSSDLLKLNGRSALLSGLGGLSADGRRPNGAAVRVGTMHANKPWITTG